MESFDGLITSIPDWHALLDNLNGTIASRQHELAQLGDYQPSIRSLRNKGSTESLRPKDNTESPIHEEDDPKIAPHVALNPTLSHPTDLPSYSNVGSPAALTPTKPTTTPPPVLSSPSSPVLAVLQRRTSNRITNAFTPKTVSPPMVRKRKTASVSSNDSRTPKYRTRSMIIVYYDSAVQLAFEELVKFISASRNAMRKGKMAARMADMRKMADLEMNSSDEEDDKESNPPTLDKSLQRRIKMNANIQTIAVRRDSKDAVDGDGDSDMDLPKLQFVSTRRMGPSRDQIAAQRQAVGTAYGIPLPPIPGILRSSDNRRPAAMGSGSTFGSGSIFDELDTGLEWSQSMCERAAHQFLRDGDCSIEIESIKRRLNEVKEAAEQHQTTHAAEELAKAQKALEEKSKSDLRTPEKPRGEMYGGSPWHSEKSRSLKAIQMRRTPTMGLSTEPEIPTTMEVDEGFEDEEEEEEIPKLVWRSARDL